MRLTALFLALLPLPAFGDTLMTATEFDAYVTGKVMDFSQAGQVWGTDRLLYTSRCV